MSLQQPLWRCMPGGTAEHSMQADEYLDLVDIQDRVIATKLRSEVYAEHLHNFRVVNAFLVNAEGKLWIPRRSSTKRIFPLCLDMSMGGHVESGESYEEAFMRELQEELRIDARTHPFTMLGKLTPHEHNMSAFMQVYELRTDATPQFNNDDFVEYFWLSPDELFQRIYAGEKTKGDLPKLVRHFYAHSN